ncbi:MAG: isochorismatase family protein [Bauldia sp.]|nr:isochorismatase family protein [Bauldia sp.]
MTLVQFPRSARRVGAGRAIIAFVDFQHEYLAEGRPHTISEAQPALDRSARLLAAARDFRMPVAHFRQVRQSPYFNREAAVTDWIEPFRPRGHEMVFERAKPSVYASGAFTSFLRHIDSPVIVLAGLSSDQACLATAIDAFHRDHTLIYVSDCSATPSIDHMNETASHSFVADLIARYAQVITLADFVEQAASA